MKKPTCPMCGHSVEEDIKYRSNCKEYAIPEEDDEVFIASLYEED